ncbi:MAG: hypothetical protein LCH92_22400 [Proteobacteria bacterium]|nr:hypothetical protein [Pseudomonadota bacterium]
MRTTKAEYLEAVDVLLDQLPRVRARLADVICDGEASETSSGFATLARNFEASWDGSFSAPNECRRLDQSIQSLLATVSNSGLVWQQRGKGGRSDRQTQGLMKTYAEDLATLANDIAFLRRDLR